jgi:3-oxoacyl-[acyl-carrier protein] reductase|tara:strand:+ start:350 stop:1093 length:744 start_codon:yes stop_codon:yes gene_type:complete
MLLDNKTAVLTGSNRGIGKKILEVFSMNGAKVFACVREINDSFKFQVDQVEKKTKNQIIIIKLDLGSEVEIKNAANEIVSSKIPIDILINNAGIIHNSIFQMTSIKKFKEIFDINFFSQALFTQYILKSMVRNKKGSIVNISSTSGIDANAGRSAYSASKAALISQSKALSRELGVHNIRVNTIAPGLTDTDMMKNNTTKDVIDNVLENVSLKRLANPEEIANAVLLLSSDLSSYITGQTIRVDGGM